MDLPAVSASVPSRYWLTETKGHVTFKIPYNIPRPRTFEHSMHWWDITRLEALSMVARPRGLMLVVVPFGALCQYTSYSSTAPIS